MSNTNVSTKPGEEKEPTVQRAVRSSKNVFQRCFGCLQTTDDKAMIKYKEVLIANRKKEFGVLYVDLVRKNSTEEELKKALDDCMKDVDVLVKEIETIENEINRINNDVESKIQRAPGAPAGKVDSKTGEKPATAAAAEEKEDLPEQSPAESA